MQHAIVAKTYSYPRNMPQEMILSKSFVKFQLVQEIIIWCGHLSQFVDIISRTCIAN